jgi:hypothetical protein
VWELEKGRIIISYNNRRGNTEVRINTDEIRLVEIVTMFPELKEPSYCLVYHQGSEPLTIEFRDVPEADIRAFCQENNLTLADVTPPFAAVEYMDMGNKHLTLRDHRKKGWKDWKDVRIRTDSISQIEQVSEHPVSQSRWYYRVHTKDGQQYEFGSFSVDKERMEKYGAKFGFSVVERKEYDS